MYIFTSIPEEDNPHDNTHYTVETYEERTVELMRLFGCFLVACGHSKEIIDEILGELY